MYQKSRTIRGLSASRINRVKSGAKESGINSLMFKKY